MKKLKNSSEEPRDRLSDLPDSIIFEIFWLMPMREVVRTTILSKRWKNLWTTAPHLNFGWHDSKFVNTTLILWRGIRILKFKFGSWGEFLEESEFSEIDSWVRLAKEHGLEELYVYNKYKCNGRVRVDDDDDPPEELYSVPHYLYSCSSLKVLFLRGCRLQIPGNVQWTRLRSLTIEGVNLDEHLINQIVSGSPQLEVFILKLLDNDENLSIRSSSLRKLSIEKCLYSIYDDPSTVTELRIWSPNLETLAILGVPYRKCLLMDVSSLTGLNLGFYGPRLYESPLFEGTDFIGEMLEQIIPAIQHVEKVTLSDWCIKGLGALKEKSLLSPWSNLKSLTIYKRYVEYQQIVDLLQIFPNMKMLVFQSIYNSNDHFFHAILLEERNLPKSFLLQLRTVEITTVQHPYSKHGDDLIVPFVEILLKHARNLQKMVIRVEGQDSCSIPMHLFLEFQELLRNANILANSRVYFVEY